MLPPLCGHLEPFGAVLCTKTAQERRDSELRQCFDFFGGTLNDVVRRVSVDIGRHGNVSVPHEIFCHIERYSGPLEIGAVL